jgi:hypothetical protein
MLGVGWELMGLDQYKGRLREAEKNRLLWQSRVGQRRRFRLLLRAQTWPVSCPSALGTMLQSHLARAAKEATTGSKTDGSLIL